MPISCHFRDCKALLVASLTRVSGAITSDLYPLTETGWHITVMQELMTVNSKLSHDTCASHFITRQQPMQHTSCGPSVFERQAEPRSAHLGLHGRGVSSRAACHQAAQRLCATARVQHGIKHQLNVHSRNIHTCCSLHSLQLGSMQIRIWINVVNKTIFIPDVIAIFRR